MKIKQGILNGTLREAYLKDQKRNTRKQREVNYLAHLMNFYGRYSGSQLESLKVEKSITGRKNSSSL